MAVVADDHVIKHFDLEQLPGANQIARDPNVSLRGFRLTARLIVLFGVPSYDKRTLLLPCVNHRWTPPLGLDARMRSTGPGAGV